MTGLAKKIDISLAGKRFTLPLLVLALAALVYGLYGFDGVLLRDYAIYLYGGQRMAEGVPPYTSVFDHKGPLSPMIAGLGVLLSGPLGWDDIYTVRAVFYVVGCLTALAVYLLGWSVFQSRVAGFLGGLTFLGFYGYAQPVASGPEPKTPMVLFETLCLYFTVQKKWFWAGLSGSLAFLVWQPMGIFPFVAFVLAIMQSREDRYGAALRTLAGIAVPLVTIVAYYFYHGALGDLFSGLILFNIFYLVRGSQQIFLQLVGAAGNVAAPYGTMLVPIVLGMIMILRLYFLRPFQYRYAPIMLSLPAPVLWSLSDFQLADDFYVFLPYAAIGFGAFLLVVVDRAAYPRLLAALLGAVLLTVALGNTFEQVNASAAQALKGTNITLSQQRQGALEVEERLGEGMELASINSPQVLVLLHRENPNPYLWITAGVDREIAARAPGGFEGWLRDLEQADAIAFFGEGQSLMAGTHLTRDHSRKMDNWLNSRYSVEKIGPWWLYVKKSPTVASLQGVGSRESGKHYSRLS